MTIENPNLETRFPQAIAPLLFGDERYIIVDIGARHGILPSLEPLADVATFIGFEPQEQECRRLNEVYRDTHGKIRVLPYAVAGRAGKHRLYIAKFPPSSGLLPTNQVWYGRFPWANTDIIGDVEVDAVTLTDFCMQEQLHHLDFIKIDVEGMEYDVLEGGREALTAQRVLGVFSEVWWDPVAKGQRPFAEIDILLRSFGFRFFDLKMHRYPRSVLPAGRLRPGDNGKIKPVDRAYGQSWTGDALYFRDPVGELREGKLDPMWNVPMLLRLCGLLDLYDYGDCAIEILEAFRTTMLSGVPVDELIDALVPTFEGKMVPYDRYRKISLLVRKEENDRFGPTWEPPPTGYKAR